MHRRVLPLVAALIVLLLGCSRGVPPGEEVSLRIAFATGQGPRTREGARLTGEVRLQLYKGSCSVLGRRSPHGLYDGRLANQSNLEFFDNQWAQGFTSLWTLQSRLAARQQGAN